MSDAPYRDDRAADQARIAALEVELARSKERIDELEGKRSQALVLASHGALTPGQKTAAGTWFGAPMRLELTRTWDVPYPTDKFEDLVDDIRTVTRDRGRTEIMKSSLDWWSSANSRSAGPFTAVTVSVKDGRTTLLVTDRLGQLAGAIYGGVGGGVGGGGIMLPILACIAVPLASPLFIAGWLGGIYGGSRWLFKNRARKRAEALQRVFETVTAEIEKALRPPAP